MDRAKRCHARFTQDVTADEVAEANEQVKDELSDREASGEMTATERAAGRALTDEEDWIDPELAAEYGRQILANLESM